MAVNLVTYTLANNGEHAVHDVSDIPVKPPLLDIPAMDGRIICFHGFKPIINSMKIVRREAVKRRQDVRRIALTATNHEDPRGTLSGLPNESAISIWRADRALKDRMAEIILASVRDQLDEDGTYHGQIVAGPSIEKVLANNPELFNVLWENEDFAHINVFLWKGNYNCATQLGVIRDVSLIESFDVTK